MLAPSAVERGAGSSRDEVGEFSSRAQAVHRHLRRHRRELTSWSAPTGRQRLGPPPAPDLGGARARRRPHARDRRARRRRLINRDRMWHYTEGVRNWNPIWRTTASGSCPAPRRCGSMRSAGAYRSRCSPASTRSARSSTSAAPATSTPGSCSRKDHRTGVRALRFRAEPGYDRSRASRTLLRERVGKGAPAPVDAFKEHGADFVVECELAPLIAGMNALTDEPLLDPALVERRDARAGPRDGQPVLEGLAGRRHPRRPPLSRRPSHARGRAAPAARPGGRPADRGQAAHPHAQDTRRPAHRSLGARPGRDGAPLPGLWAAGEASGFGGGGMHGYRSLEGTFLGGCLFSGRTAGRALAA